MLNIFLFIVCGTNLFLPRIEAKKMYIADIGVDTAGVSVGEKLAVLSCQGLMNRNTGTDPEEVVVYTIRESWDKLWLETALEYDPEWEMVTLSIDEYLSDVCEKESCQCSIY